MRAVLAVGLLVTLNATGTRPALGFAGDRFVDYAEGASAIVPATYAWEYQDSDGTLDDDERSDPDLSAPVIIECRTHTRTLAA
jgi:hypothetical protein